MSLESSKNGAWGDDPKEDSEGVICLRVADFDRINFKIKSSESYTRRAIPENQLTVLKLMPGDILLEKSGGGEKQLVGAAITFDGSYEAICSNFVERNVVAKGYDSRFITYVHASLYSQRVNYRSIKQTTGIQNLDSKAYFNEIVTYPPIEEQQAIVRYLDKKLEQIDTFIQNKRRLIELLEEQKTAIINKAVTQGLDSSVPMKDSGVEWLSLVPAHWSTYRLKYLFEEKDRRTETGEETLLSLRMHKGLVPHDDVSEIPISDEDLVGYKITEPGEIVMNRMRAAIGMFAVTPEYGLVSPDYAIFRAKVLLENQYFVSLFKTDDMKALFRTESKGLGTGSSGFMRLYTDRFGRIGVPFPPVMEQKEIIKFIAETSLEIGKAISNANQEIDLINEYRTTLISEVVTGKIDVRDAAELLDESPESSGVEAVFDTQTSVTDEDAEFTAAD